MNLDVLFNENEIINGYPIKQFIKFNIDCLDIILFKKIWDDCEELDYLQFSEIYDDIACSEWSKMDRYGTSFGGFWKFPEASEQHNNAWNLCREDNCRALYDLPYPKKFIIKTIKIGCSSRLESVPFSNYLCELMKRKVAIIESKY